MSREPLSISLEREFIIKIDNAKGRNEPRSRFIEYVISEYLSKSGEKISPDIKPPRTTKEIR